MVTWRTNHLLCDIEHDHPSCPLTSYSTSKQGAVLVVLPVYSHFQIAFHCSCTSVAVLAALRDCRTILVPPQHAFWENQFLVCWLTIVNPKPHFSCMVQTLPGCGSVCNGGTLCNMLVGLLFLVELPFLPITSWILEWNGFLAGNWN